MATGLAKEPGAALGEESRHGCACFGSEDDECPILSILSAGCLIGLAYHVIYIV